MEILLQYKRKSTVVLVLPKKTLKLKSKYSFAKQKPFKNAINIKDILFM